MLATATDFPMPIETPRLVMHPPVLSPKSVNEYVEAVSESMNEISLWLPWAKYYPSASQTESYIATCNDSWLARDNNNIGLPLWLIDKKTQKFVGNITMWNIVWEIPKFEFGYWVRTTETNKGYITEAVNALTRYFFLQLGVRRIEIRCEKENIHAQRIPEKLAFEREAILKNSTIAVADGKLTDTVIYARIDLENLPKLSVKWKK